MEIKPFFTVLDTAIQKHGEVYFIAFFIGDCFCPKCHQPVEMGPPHQSSCYSGQCKCGYLFEARIILGDVDRHAVWETDL